MPMSRKSLLALPLVGALVLLLAGSVLADPPPPPGPEQPRTHTMTIYNGGHVLQQTFVWQDGSWRSCEDCHPCGVHFRDCPGSRRHCSGTSCSPRRAGEVACSPRARGNLAPVRQHCP